MCRVVNPVDVDSLYPSCAVEVSDAMLAYARRVARIVREEVAA